MIPGTGIMGIDAWLVANHISASSIIEIAQDRQCLR